jgi:hypothetical protein
MKGVHIPSTGYRAASFLATIADQGKTFEAFMDSAGTGRVKLSNMDLVVDDTFTGQTVTIGYTKSDNTTGTLTFRRGVLTSYT